MSAGRFCAAHGLTVTSLYWWSGKLKREATSPTREVIPLAQVIRRRILATEPRAVGHDAPMVVIELDGARVFVGPGAARETLDVVLEALDGRPRRFAR
jgi:hypothetical protein